MANNSNDEVKNSTNNSTNEIENRVKGMTACRVPEDDTISRQAAIDIFDDYNVSVENGELEAYGRDRKRLCDLPSAQPETIRCKDCKHKPYSSDNYDYDNGDCGFEIIFPDYRCPCRCDDEYYNRIPDDDWFCGNAERRTDEPD